LTHSDAVLEQEGANLVDYSGALADEPASDAVERLKIELLVALEGHKAHGWALHRLCNRLGIAIVVLVALQKRLDVFRWHQANVVAECGKLAANVMGSGAGLHADAARRNVCQAFRQCGARQSFAQKDRSFVVHSANMKGILAKIDADCRDDVLVDSDHGCVLRMTVRAGGTSVGIRGTES
jgi:hypothetical protein